MAYDIAITKLNEKERSQIDSDMISCYTVYSVLDAANKARADRDENKWQYRNKNGEIVILRDRFDKIVEGFTKYAGLIGTMVQTPQPEATGLVWAAARSLIEVCNFFTSVILGLTSLGLPKLQGNHKCARRIPQGNCSIDGKL
jgi:hypothetical protein